MLRGRCHVELHHDHLTTTETLGPLRYTRRRPHAHLKRLHVETGTVSSNGGPKQPTPNVAALSAEYQPTAPNPKPFHLALAYPAAWLHELAEQLATALGTEHDPLVGQPPTIPVVVSTPDDPTESPPDPEPPRPDTDALVIEDRGDELTLRAPPQPLIKGSHGLGCFAGIWLAFMTLFTIILLGITFFPTQPHTASNPAPPPALFAFAAAFWLIGLGLLAAALNLAKRATVIDVLGTGTNATLLVNTKPPFTGLKQHQFHHADLQHIRVGPTGTTVNNQPVMQLELHPTTGKKLGLLPGLKTQTLQWIAWRLRQQTQHPR